MKIWSKVLASILVLALLSLPATAQSLLPNGQQTFVDANGAPLAGGKVYFYVPNTTTAKFTYQDPAETTPNTNPVVLNAAGRAVVWGSGQYREVVYDQFGDLIWDQLTTGTDMSQIAAFGAAMNITAASTTDLGTIVSHNVIVTGAGSITSFGTSASLSAPVYLLRFTNGITLVNNFPTLNLPGQANITTAASDAALAEYAGSGQWIVIGYWPSNGQALVPQTIPAVLSHKQVFTSSGTFTTPAGSTTATVYKVTVTGGGGGITVGTATGGAGATGISYINGIGPSTAVTVTVGAGGASTANGTASGVFVGLIALSAGGGFANGNPGTVSGFDINLPGGTGERATGTTVGGASFWGGGSGSGGTAPAYGAGAGTSASSAGGGIVTFEWTL